MPASRSSREQPVASFQTSPAQHPGGCDRCSWRLTDRQIYNVWPGQGASARGHWFDPGRRPVPAAWLVAPGVACRSYSKAQRFAASPPLPCAMAVYVRTAGISTAPTACWADSDRHRQDATSSWSECLSASGPVHLIERFLSLYNCPLERAGRTVAGPYLRGSMHANAEPWCSGGSARSKSSQAANSSGGCPVACLIGAADSRGSDVTFLPRL